MSKTLPTPSDSNPSDSDVALPSLPSITGQHSTEPSLVNGVAARTPYFIAWSAVGSVVGSAISLIVNTPTLPASILGSLGATLFGALAVLGVFSRYKDDKRRQFAAELRDLNKMFVEGLINRGELRTLRKAAQAKYLR